MTFFLSACATKPIDRHAASTNSDLQNFVCLSKDQGVVKGCARSPDKDSSCGIEYAFYKECRTDLAPIIPFEALGIKLTEIDTTNGEDGIYRSLPEIADQTYNKYSSKEIALSLVQRKFIFEEVKNISNSDFNIPRVKLFEDLQIVMEFPSKYLSKIMKDGFKNLHQTGDSSAFKDAEWRIKRESLFFKVKFTKEKHRNKIHEILPKYAYAIPTSDKSDLGPSYMAGYADLIAVFKNRVKLFSTLTNDDSLFGTGSWGLLDINSNAGFLPPLTFTALNADCKAFRNECLKNTSYDKGYLEAQIWGPLLWSDVDYIIVGCSSNNDSVESIVKTISGTVPVYQCRPVTKSGKVIRIEKGELISK